MTAGDGEVTLELDGHEVVISSPGKVFFSERGETKRDLVEFYRAVRDPLLAAMGGRPVLLQRFPEGAEGSSFFQKRVPASRPPWLQTADVSTPNGTISNALVAADPDHTDELRIDLDPTPGVTFDMVREGALVVRDVLGELGLVGWPKTTGNRGIHVYLRLERRWDSYQVRAAAVALARQLERRRPDLLTAAWWKEERGRRVFVDFNQNAPHKTVFGAWCVRARPGAQVSTPFHWDELDEAFHPDRLTMPVVAERVARDGDPWAGMYEGLQSIEPLLAMYDRDLAAGLMDAPWPPVYPKQPNEPPRVAPSRAKKPKPEA